MEYNTKEYIETLKSKYRCSGISSMSELEILELLLSYGKIRYENIREVAQMLLNRFYTLYCIFERSPQTLMETEHMTMQAAIILNMQSSLFRIYSRQREYCNMKSLTEDNKYSFIRSLFIGYNTEHFYAIMMSAKNKITVDLLSSGTINRTNVYTRRVIELALQREAQTVLFVHNHPNGIYLPSAEDIQTTINLHDALREIGVNFDDHIIVTENRMISLVKDMNIFHMRRKDYDAKIVIE